MDEKRARKLFNDTMQRKYCDKVWYIFRRALSQNGMPLTKKNIEFACGIKLQSNCAMRDLAEVIKNFPQHSQTAEQNKKYSGREILNEVTKKLGSYTPSKATLHRWFGTTNPLDESFTLLQLVSITKKVESYYQKQNLGQQNATN